MDLQDVATPQDGAAFWDARLRSPECTAQDRAAFARWRESAPANRVAFETLQNVIHRTRSVRHRPEARAISNAAIAMTRQRPRALFWWSTAAAAVIVAASAAWWGHQLFDSMAAPGGLRVETEVNDHRELELADGSKVTLGARSQLTVRIDGGSRKLWLESGQAYFEVAKDEVRPFVVYADGGTITATGTGFDVHQIGGQVEVTVVEGSVVVQGAPMAAPGMDGSGSAEFPTTSLKEGQRLGFGDVLTPIETVDPETALAWRGGYLNYGGQPLSEVIADVQRYTKKQLVLADAEVGKLKFRGTVYRNNVQDWLERLDESLPVDVEFPNRRTVILRSRPAP